MPRRRCQIWRFAVLVHGSRGLYRCMFCSYTFGFSHITRFRYHLARINCEGAVTCPNVTTEAYEEATNEIARRELVVLDTGLSFEEVYQPPPFARPPQPPYARPPQPPYARPPQPPYARPPQPPYARPPQPPYARPLQPPLAGPSQPSLAGPSQPSLAGPSQPSLAVPIQPPHVEPERTLSARVSALEASNLELRRQNQILQERVDRLAAFLSLHFPPHSF